MSDDGSLRMPEDVSPHIREQRRLIRTMERYGGKGFRILRSAETGIRKYKQRGRITAARRTIRDGARDE